MYRHRWWGDTLPDVGGAEPAGGSVRVRSAAPSTAAAARGCAETASDQFLEFGATAAAAVVVNRHDRDSQVLSVGSRGKACQPLTDVPEPSRYRSIVGFTRRSSWLH